jgi:hypothetical protein
MCSAVSESAARRRGARATHPSSNSWRHRRSSQLPRRVGAARGAPARCARARALALTATDLSFEALCLEQKKRAAGPRSRPDNGDGAGAGRHACGVARPRAKPQTRLIDDSAD